MKNKYPTRVGMKMMKRDRNGMAVEMRKKVVSIESANDGKLGDYLTNWLDFNHGEPENYWIEYFEACGDLERFDFMYSCYCWYINTEKFSRCAETSDRQCKKAVYPPDINPCLGENTYDSFVCDEQETFETARTLAFEDMKYYTPCQRRR